MKKVILLLIVVCAVCALLICGCENSAEPQSQHVETTPTQNTENSHVHVFDLEVANSDFLCREANCETPTMYYKSCACGAKGTETFTVGEKIPHKVIDGECAYCHRCDIVCAHYSVDDILLSSMEGLSSPALCSCDECNEIFYKDLTADDIDMPIIYFDNTFYECASRFPTEGKVNVSGIKVKYTSCDLTFEDTCTLKIQGSSSSTKPKKNYNIKFNSKVKLVNDWGKQKKYCLKANYVDFSQARNIISGKLYGQVVHSRNIDDEVNDLPNGGAVDGYPVLLYVNNAYYGLYTLNIPKDKWLMDMENSDEKDQAMLSTNSHEDSVLFKSNIDWATEGDSSWEFEFYSNEESEIDDDFMWAVDGINQLITFVNTATDEEFKSNLKNYMSIERALDVLIFVNLIAGDDNLGKNLIWITYDGGATWQPSPYDMDGTWGMFWNGSFEEMQPTFDAFTSIHMSYLWTRVNQCFADEIKMRYSELRQEIYSYDNIEKLIRDFESSIYSPLFDLEKVKWSAVPSNNIDHYEQMLTWIQARMTYLDAQWLIKA